MQCFRVPNSEKPHKYEKEHAADVGASEYTTLYLIKQTNGAIRRNFGTSDAAITNLLTRYYRA